MLHRAFLCNILQRKREHKLMCSRIQLLHHPTLPLELDIKVGGKRTYKRETIQPLVSARRCCGVRVAQRAFMRATVTRKQYLQRWKSELLHQQEKQLEAKQRSHHALNTEGCFSLNNVSSMIRGNFLNFVEIFSFDFRVNLVIFSPTILTEGVQSVHF